MNDSELRDQFAAAALTGLLAGGLRSSTLLALDAYKVADEMLRLRGAAVSDNCVTGNQPEIPCPTNHDAVPPQDRVVRLPALKWQHAAYMGDGERRYRFRVQEALDAAGVRWEVLDE
jgi:hypothetical protein